MSTFNETNLVKKLESVTSSQDSIQTLSLWVLHHKNHYRKIIDQWLKCYIKAKSSHQLALFYLANDIVQHAKRKNLPHYQNEFMHALREAAKVTNDEKIMNNINRVLQIWQERSVYSKEFTDELKDLLCGEKIKSEVISKIITDFSPIEVINQINNIVKIEQSTRAKYQSLVNCKIDFTNSESLNKLKDKTFGEQFRKELDEATNRLESTIMAIEKENACRKNLLTNLEKSRIYYAIQMKEAKKIAETFSNCEAGLKQVQNLLKSYGYETSSLTNANQMGTSQLSSVLSIFQQNNNNNNNSCTSVSSLDQRLTNLMSGTGKFGLNLDPNPYLAGKNLNINNNNNMNIPTNFFMTTDNNSNKKKEINQIESVITNRPYSLENPLENFEPADMDLGDSEDEDRQQQFNYRDVDASKSIAPTLPFPIGTPDMAGLLPMIPPPPPPPPPPIPPSLFQEFIGSSIENDLGGTFVASPNVSTIPSIVVDTNNFNNNNDNMMRNMSNRSHRNSSSSSSYQAQQHHSSNQSWRQSPGENTRYNNNNSNMGNNNNNNHHNRHGQNYHHYNNNRHGGGGGGGNRWKNGGGSGSWKRANYDHHH